MIQPILAHKLGHHRPTCLRRLPILVALAAFWSTNASAGEIMAGVYAHGRSLDISPLKSIGGFEGGEQIVVGYATDRLTWLRSIGRPRAYGLAAVNTRGGTNFISAGLEWRIPLVRSLYVAPAMGLAVHDGVVARFQGQPDELNLGSRLLFSPSFAVGWKLTNRLAVEASYIHLSHAKLAGAQNPGLDEAGVRFVYSLGR